MKRYLRLKTNQHGEQIGTEFWCFDEEGGEFETGFYYKINYQLEDSRLCDGDYPEQLFADENEAVKVIFNPNGCPVFIYRFKQLRSEFRFIRNN